MRRLKKDKLVIHVICFIIIGLLCFPLQNEGPRVEPSVYQDLLAEYERVIEDESLVGVTLPDYYYVLTESQRQEDTDSSIWEGDYLCYDGIILKDGALYHIVYLIQEEEKRIPVR